MTAPRKAGRPLTGETKIERSNSSYGNWVIRISASEVKFFWRKADALKWLAENV